MTDSLKNHLGSCLPQFPPFPRFSLLLAFPASLAHHLNSTNGGRKTKLFKKTFMKIKKRRFDQARVTKVELKRFCFFFFFFETRNEKVFGDKLEFCAADWESKFEFRILRLRGIKKKIEEKEKETAKCSFGFSAEGLEFRTHRSGRRFIQTLSNKVVNWVGKN